jgi:predicted nucleic acid-binding protein
MKQKVYIETTVISYLTGRLKKDIIVRAHQEITKKWWKTRASGFELVISELVYSEASAGDTLAASESLDAVKEFQIISITSNAVDLAEKLLSTGLIPKEFAEDALHIALAASNGIDYLLTWNCKHLANAALRARIEAVIEGEGYSCPVICTPEELMED